MISDVHTAYFRQISGFNPLSFQMRVADSGYALVLFARPNSIESAT